jgi:hypothetical protein
MAKSIKVHPKKRRGRPATGKDPLVSARLPQPLIDQVEQWSASNSVTRSEAVRRLVELGLKAKTAGKPVAKPGGRRLRAQELAAQAIDKMIDPSAPAEERDQRRRRLTKGPEEFREVRVDRPKAKR